MTELAWLGAGILLGLLFSRRLASPDVDRKARQLHSRAVVKAMRDA